MVAKRMHEHGLCLGPPEVAVAGKRIAAFVANNGIGAEREVELVDAFLARLAEIERQGNDFTAALTAAETVLSSAPQTQRPEAENENIVLRI